MTPEPLEIAVAGGGVTGLAAAHRLLTTAPAGSVRVTVFEAGPRFGGWIRTERFAERPVDFGPDSLLVRTPWAAELCRELAIDDELVAPGSGGAFLLLEGELRSLPGGILAGLPDGPRPFVESGLVSKRGMARAALDLVRPANAPKGDESIGSLVRRRLGDEVLERVIDPLLGGVHAGRCDDLSLEATAPQIAAAARADRSLLRGLRKTAPPPPAAGAPRRPVFMGPRGGMERIVAGLLEVLGSVGAGAGADVAAGSGARGVVELRADAPVESVAAAEDGRVRVSVLGEGESRAFDGLIVALPAEPTSELLAPHAPTGAAMLAGLRYASVAQIALAYPAEVASRLPQGTGFLVPRGQGTLMTACTFLDQKWPERRGLADALDSDPGRGPLADAVVIKCSAGRIDDARIDTLTDDQLAVAIHRELERILGGFPAGTKPVAHRVFRARGGLPQYAPGHIARIDALVAETQAVLPAVSLAGAAFRGTSVPLCIRQGRDAADAQLARLGVSPVGS